jgi:hypothetical protein
MLQLSPNVTLEQAEHSDAAIRAKIDNTTEDSGIIACMKQVATYCFEPIKKQFPDAFINSFYRNPETNKLVGGQPTSQHQKGQAIDISRGNRVKNLELLNWCKTNLIYDQLLNEFPDANGDPAWVHVSFITPLQNNRKQFLIIK